MAASFVRHSVPSTPEPPPFVVVVIAIFAPPATSAGTACAMGLAIVQTIDQARTPSQAQKWLPCRRLRKPDSVVPSEPTPRL